MAVTNDELARALHEVIEALDRRAPRAEPSEEAAIAEEARVLRRAALRRLEDLGDPEDRRARQMSNR